MNKNFATQKIATKFDKFHLTDHQNLIGILALSIFVESLS